MRRKRGESSRLRPFAEEDENLRRSIETGLVQNDRGQVINYLEIYEGDIVNPAMQQVLHAAQHQLLKNVSP